MLRQIANPNVLRLQVNRWLRRFDLGLYRPSWIDAQVRDRSMPSALPLPPDAAATLQPRNPRLLELRQRYRGHPAATLSGWSDLRLEGQIDLQHFRADGQYLFQARGTSEAAYALTADYLCRHGALGLLDALVEDGVFGALTFQIDGRCVSRDLLDSALEIEALAAWMGRDALLQARVLDIGAGYGRLAHRLCAWSRGVEVVAADAVPVSTFLCEYYLGYRNCERASVVPLDQAQATIEANRFDVATNVHSFAEAPRAAVTWWLERIAAAGVPKLFIVHSDRELFTVETDLSRGSYDDVLERLGYRRVALREKYASSETVQRLGVYPAWYHAFERA